MSRSKTGLTLVDTAEEAAALADRYVLITPGELSEPLPPMQWLIRGVWPLGSYGPFGGSKKTLKTYIASILALAVASGRPAFNNDEWSVPEARPVIYYGGEGGRRMHQARLQRIARDVYGIDDISTLPFYLVTDIGPFDKPEFWKTLDRNIAQINSAQDRDVALVVLDSLYNYHPADIEVSNLYERGRLLGALSAPLIERGVSLWLVDHFNKTGSGIDLDRLAQSGMSAWADSWLLFEHATEPDVGSGKFAISTGLGSRQWGGEEWTLHIDIGPFDKEASGYLTAMKVEAEPGITKRARGSGDVDVTAAILNHVEANPDQTFTKSREAVKEVCGVGDTRIKSEWEALAEAGRLISSKAPVSEGGRNVTRDVWRVAESERPPQDEATPPSNQPSNPPSNRIRVKSGSTSRRVRGRS